MAHLQQSLFELEPPAWEADAADERRVATIVLSQGMVKPLDYLIPEPLREMVQPGCRVRVPLGRGNRPVLGTCVAISDQDPTGRRRLKELSEVVDRRSLLSPAMLRLTQWMAEYYLCDWGQVLETVIPAGVRGQAGTRMVALLSLAPGAAAQREQIKLPVVQAKVFDYLAAQMEPVTPDQVCKMIGCTRGPLAALRKLGLVVSESKRVRSTEPTEVLHEQEQPLEMNPDQRAALDTILAALNAQRHETVLVHGVTGSGKTEVYIQAIREVVGFGRQTIVLVPEISLTPQTLSRFRARFGKVAVLHSHLSDAERHWQWEQIADGQVQVVVGARSAIFAPTPHLGLIIIDEEHEATFKQETTPRYRARDVAHYRAAAEGVPLVLGSATPSLESYFQATAGSDRLVEMPRRVFDRPMPEVATIDLRLERQDPRSRGALSRPLAMAVDKALADGGQVILLLNRRGFATHVQCPACGKAIQCPQCDIALTHHRQDHMLICHYCDHRQAEPERCPECDFDGIRFSGRGTQRLEAEVNARFPRVGCLRMDADSMQRHGSHEQALRKFRDGEVKILLGTQMIAKGLDFPNVTLVGVINADTALHLPDFRAGERTFQLVTQVAGRTGRGPRGGRVLVQTYEPDHPAIRAAIRHDYAMFAAHELPIRKTHGYPPFTTMVRLVMRSEDQAAARGFAAEMAERLKRANSEQEAGARLLGPCPASFPKLLGKHRFVVQLLAEDGEKLRAAVRAAIEDVKTPETVQWIVDVDPVDMM